MEETLARMWEDRNTHRILVGSLKGTDRLEDLGIRSNTIF